MKKEVDVIVKQIEEAPVAVEVLAASIVSISDGIKKLRTSGLNANALILLIQHASPAAGKGWNRKNITAKQVESVLNGLASLRQAYLSKP